MSVGGYSTSCISILLLILIARKGAVNDAVAQRSGWHSCVMAKEGKHKNVQYINGTTSSQTTRWS